MASNPGRHHPQLPDPQGVAGMEWGMNGQGSLETDISSLRFHSSFHSKNCEFQLDGTFSFLYNKRTVQRLKATTKKVVSRLSAVRPVEYLLGDRDRRQVLEQPGPRGT